MSAYETGTISSTPTYRNVLIQLRDFATSDHVATAVVAAGGSGYSVGDILTVSGGTPSTVACTAEVLTLSVTAVATVKIRQSGGYSSNPSTPAATTVVPSGGTGCTLTLTFTGVLWTANRDELDNHQTDERELQLEGVGAGADEIYVGIRSYNSGVATNWELAGFTGFSSGLTWENQPGRSPGDYTTTGAFVLLASSSSIEYWFNVTGRRIIGVCKSGTGYASFYLGWINQYATSSEYPYPLAIIGSSNQEDQQFNSSEIHYSSIVDPIKDGSDTQLGPGFFRFTDGQWYSTANGINGGTTRAGVHNVPILPCGAWADLPDDENLWFGTNDFQTFRGVIPSAGDPGTPQRRLVPTTDSGDDIYALFPATIAMSDPSMQLPGELDEVYWIDAEQGLTAEDIINDDYTAFSAGSRTESWAHFAIRTSG